MRMFFAGLLALSMLSCWRSAEGKPNFMTKNGVVVQREDCGWLELDEAEKTERDLIDGMASFGHDRDKIGAALKTCRVILVADDFDCQIPESCPAGICLIPGKCMGSATWTGTEMLIKVSQTWCVWSSAYSHELMHGILRHLEGSSDWNHTKVQEWKLVEDLQSQRCW